MLNLLSRQTKGNLAGQCILLMAIIVVIAGCTASRRNAVDIYDSRGNRIVQATDTYVLDQVYPFYYDQVYRAALTILFRNGFQIERDDKDNGVIQASKMHYQMFAGGGLNVPYTVCVQVLETTNSKRARIKMVVDAHWGIPAAIVTIKTEPPAQKYGPQLVSELQWELSMIKR